MLTTHRLASYMTQISRVDPTTCEDLELAPEAPGLDERTRPRRQTLAPFQHLPPDCELTEPYGRAERIAPDPLTPTETLEVRAAPCCHVAATLGQITPDHGRHAGTNRRCNPAWSLQGREKLEVLARSHQGSSPPSRTNRPSGFLTPDRRPNNRKHLASGSFVCPVARPRLRAITDMKQHVIACSVLASVTTACKGEAPPDVKLTACNGGYALHERTMPRVCGRPRNRRGHLDGRRARGDRPPRQDSKGPQRNQARGRQSQRDEPEPSHLHPATVASKPPLSSVSPSIGAIGCVAPPRSW